MRLDNELVLGFFHEDQFDLHSYITYLFNKRNSIPDKMRDQMVKQ